MSRQLLEHDIKKQIFSKKLLTKSFSGRSIIIILVGYISILLIIHFIGVYALEKLNCTKTNDLTAEYIDPLSKTCKKMSVVYTYFSIIISLFIFIITVAAIAAIFHAIGFSGDVVAIATGIGSMMIGLGCQSFIKDIFNGFMFILEGQAAVGDRVQITLLNGATEEYVTGVISAFNIRNMTLEKENGGVSYISNGNIASITNLSKKPTRLSVVCDIFNQPDPSVVITSLNPIVVSLENDAIIVKFLLSPPTIGGIVPSKDAPYGITIDLNIKPGTEIRVMSHLNFILQAWGEKNGITFKIRQ